MRTKERHISPDSRYFVYSPSKNAREMFLYPLQCGRFIYEPGYSLDRRSFDSFLIMYAEKGSFELRAGDCAPRTVSAGQFALIDCYAPHGYSSNGGCTCLWCHFDGVTARHWYENIRESFGDVLTLPDPRPAAGKLSAIYETFLGGGVVREPLLSKYLNDILTEMVLRPSAGAGPSAVENAATYISEHFSEKLTVAELAAMAGFSRYHFIRVFKRQTGFTPYEYLINTRMSNARYLLKNTAMTVKEICFSTGFSGESSFCGAFKRLEGMTPAQYRSGGGPHAPATSPESSSMVSSSFGANSGESR